MAVVAIATFFVVIAAANAIYFGVMHRHGFRFFRSVPPAPPYAFDQSRSMSFRGGSHIGIWRTTVPLVKLTVDDVRARVSGLGRTVDIERRLVTNVKRTGLTGIRFDSIDGRYDGLRFLTFDRPNVLGTFASLGWPTAEAPSRIRPLGKMRQGR